MAVVNTLSAKTRSELVEISWRMDAAEFEPGNLRFDEESGVVDIEFVQEPRDLDGQIPASVLVRSMFLFDEYAVSFLRYRFAAAGATDLRVSGDVKHDARELTGAEFEVEAGTLRVGSNLGLNRDSGTAARRVARDHR